MANKNLKLAIGTLFFLIALVSISRVYLGVHFMSDVIGAVGIAIALLWAFHRFESRLTERIGSLSDRWQLGMELWAAVALLALGFAVQLAIEGIADPPAWANVARSARELGGLFSSSGEFFGTACGLILAKRWANFELSSTWWKRVAALLYALLGAWLIREFIKLVPSPRAQELRWVFDFARGTVVNGWMLFVAPWILLKMGLLHSSLVGCSAPPDPKLATEGCG